MRDLEAAGATVTEAGSFDAAPLAPEATNVCVDGEEVKVYVYPSEEERTVATARIDPDDPTNIGTAIVEWAGAPKFWERDRILVLYLGNNDDTTTLIDTVLGPPFARGPGRPAQIPSVC